MRIFIGSEGGMKSSIDRIGDFQAASKNMGKGVL
jgi:hypothetical protein